MQRDKSRKQHTRKQVEMKLMFTRRTLRSMEGNVCDHQRTLDKNLEKAGNLSEKMERLWLQPALFDELLAFIKRHNRNKGNSGSAVPRE